MLRKGDVVVFQGDSITDGGRSRDDDQNHIMGHGFAYIATARLMADHPDLSLTFYNRGVSGNRVVDLYARWREDAINLMPSVVSILVGINDVSAEIIRNAGVSAERFEKVLRLLLDETSEAIEAVRFILCEPFYLPNQRRDPHNDRYVEEVTLRASIVASLAREKGATFVPLQRIFDEAAERAPASYWLWDGVHPTPQGHELIARQWLAAVERV